MNENRKLATLQRVLDVSPIENADFIEKIKIMGWNVVVKKDEFKVGDLGIYFEIDSFLPEIPKYEFMRSSSFKNNLLMGTGFLVKTRKLRNVISQGLFMPLTEFPEIDFTGMEVGTDLTKALGVRVYEAVESKCNVGNAISRFHDNISKSDELRLQSAEFLGEALKGYPYYISEKIDGFSTLISKEDDKIRVFIRNSEIKDDGESILWQMFRKKGIVDVLKNCEDIFIQGETFGPKIQKNRLNVKSLDFRFFNLGNPHTGDYYDYVDWNEILNRTGLNNVVQSVKILEEGNNFQYTLDELLEKSNGNYENAGQREGIVIRPQREMKVGNQRLSFKVLNNKYLLKNED